MPAFRTVMSVQFVGGLRAGLSWPGAEGCARVAMDADGKGWGWYSGRVSRLLVLNG